MKKENIESTKENQSSKKNIVRKKPKPKKPGFFSELFFTQFNFLFNLKSNEKLTEEKLLPLPDGINTKTLLPIALKIKKEITKEEKKNDEKEKTQLQKTLKDIRKKIDFLDVTDKNKVQTLIYKMIKPKIIKAIILRVIEKFIIMALSITPLYYNPQVKKSVSERNNYILLLTPLVAFLLAFLRGIVKEHCNKFLNQCGSTTGQTLRALFYDKIEKSNISFLVNADGNVISKITQFEIQKISKFVGKVPDVAGFPVAVTLSCIAMVYFISWGTMVILVIFGITWLLLFILAKLQSWKNLKNEYFSSMRGQKIDEIIKDVETMKFSNFENNLKMVINQLREREIKFRAKSNYYKNISTFVMSTSIITAILIIIVVETYLNEDKLSVAKTYAIVAIMGNLSKPMKEFVNILEQYFYYNNAVDAMNKILFVLSLKPEDSEIDKKINQGEIRVEECTIEIEDNDEVRKIIDGIFGEKLDLKREKELYERKLSKFALENEKGENRGIMKRGVTSQVFLGVKKASQTLTSFKGSEIINLKKNIRISNFKNIFQRKKKKQIMDIKRVVVQNKLNLLIKPKEKICLVGDESQGISEIIGAILGESFITEGSVHLNGSISYIDGRFPSFLIKKTIKENILMGTEFNKKKYKKIIDVVQLDLRKFLDSDESIVLEDGVNFALSEKVKILLARTLYLQDSDIYIFENVFDFFTPEIISSSYNNIVNEYLKDKTVIIRSNNKFVMKKVEKLIAFKDKKIYYEGNPLDFIIQDTEFEGKKNLKKGIKNVMDLNKMKNFFQETQEKQDQLVHNKPSNKVRAKAFKVLKNKFKKGAIVKYINQANNQMKFLNKSNIKPIRFNVLDESKVYQNLRRLLFRYIFYRGKSPVIFTIFLYIFSIGLFVFVDVWAGAWSSDYFKMETINYTYIWIISIFFAGGFLIFRDYFYYKVLIGHSNKAHSKLLQKLLRVDLMWFNTTDNKRLGYKFSYDMKILDSILSSKLQNLLESLMFFTAGMVILNYIYFGLMAIVTIIMLIYVNWLTKKFLKSMKFLVKLRTRKAADLKSTFGFVNQQMLNFRLAKKEHILRELFNKSSNEFQRAATHIAFYSGRWFGIRMIVINTTLITVSYIIPLIFIYMLENTQINLDRSVFQLAFATSWSLKLTDFFTRIVNSVVGIYSDIDSFGRIENFIEKCEIDNVKEEPIVPVYRTNLIKETIWRPELIKLENIQLSISGKKIIEIKDVEIKKKEMIALMGPGGAGKKLFMSMIMQLYKRDEGGLRPPLYSFLRKNADDINKRIIRSEIGYVDNDPYIYSGSVRHNLDPDYLYTKEELIRVLDMFEAHNFLVLSRKEQGGKWVLRYKDDDDLKDGNEFVSLGELDGGVSIDVDSIDIELIEDQGSSGNPSKSEKERLNKKRKTTKSYVPEKNEIKERKAICAFLASHVNSKRPGMPPDLLDLIVTVRAYLKNPRIFFAYQSSLNFSLHGFMKILKIFKKLHNGNISIVVLLKRMKDLKFFERAILLKEGRIDEDGPVKDLINNEESKLSSYVKKTNIGDYNFLRDELEIELGYKDMDVGFFNENIDVSVFDTRRFGRK